ncbi:MAG: DUF4332 domain-containing protein [Saprospiraceae bacterium]|nr:DUF4332 domain-containing protein [Saprospiraceae bacterium]
MARKVTDIEGIGPASQTKLSEIEITTVDQLLEKGATPKGRQEIHEKTGIDAKRVLKWVGMADLFRIKGVASQFAELLKAAGVDTVKELKMRNADNLHTKLVEVNEEKKLARAVPRLEQVKDFVQQAKELEPVVTY